MTTEEQLLREILEKVDALAVAQIAFTDTLMSHLPDIQTRVAAGLEGAADGAQDHAVPRVLPHILRNLSRAALGEPVSLKGPWFSPP